ncbi:hypothetical protein LAZ67_4002795 [Cordylochernes scorpioides]|uniref:Uncharacterized protein n=1 Tax=Cordylochernes scorpioides TaxID=51811 RepID=A0ABY6KHU2_9ARAC|nr:hypothetical protein LAZ67_4002795 [Cordylochernes scorpioides]
MSEHSRNISNQDTRSLLYQHTLNTGHTFNTNHPTIHYRRIHNQHQRLVLESIESHRHNSINRKIDLPDAYRAPLALQCKSNNGKWRRCKSHREKKQKLEMEFTFAGNKEPKALRGKALENMLGRDAVFQLIKMSGQVLVGLESTKKAEGNLIIGNTLLKVFLYRKRAEKSGWELPNLYKG